jgi:hypothetical protein
LCSISIRQKNADDLHKVQISAFWGLHRHEQDKKHEELSKRYGTLESVQRDAIFA